MISRSRPQRFDGWIELAAAIEDWRTNTARPDSRQPPSTHGTSPGQHIHPKSKDALQ